MLCNWFFSEGNLQKFGCTPESGIDQALKGVGNKLALIVDYVEFSSDRTIRKFNGFQFAGFNLFTGNLLRYYGNAGV